MNLIQIELNCIKFRILEILNLHPCKTITMFCSYFYFLVIVLVKMQLYILFLCFLEFAYVYILPDIQVRHFMYKLQSRVFHCLVANADY